MARKCRASASAGTPTRLTLSPGAELTKSDCPKDERNREDQQQIRNPSTCIRQRDDPRDDQSGERSEEGYVPNAWFHS
jgi:hypothetical protein